MTKKHLNICLIILVMGLWSVLIYKSVNHFFFSEKFVKNKKQDIRNTVFINTKKDTFVIEKLSRDPFLNKINIPVSTPIEQLTTSNNVKKINKVYVENPKPVNFFNWPLITYYGYIKSKKKEQELVLIKIDKTVYKCRKKDQILYLTIDNVYNDSIEVNFNGEKKIVRRE